MVRELSDGDYLPFIAALNSAKANWITLTLVQIFGERKTRTDEKGTGVVAKWRGNFYMLDYTPPAPEPDAGQTKGA